MHASTLVDALKRLLKAHDVTYARVAAGLGLSEASVKRMFSRRDFTLQRLEAATREPHQTADQPHLFVAARRSDPAAFPSPLGFLRRRLVDTVHPAPPIQARNGADGDGPLIYVAGSCGNVSISGSLAAETTDFFRPR